jgi:AraC-like ligand binding domain
MKDSSLSVKSNFRYLPVLKEQVQWGLFLTDCGYASIESGASYPPSGHPSAYASNWGKGRTLNEYQVNYITRGGGIFETRDSGCHLIEEGDIFVLFPGVWHRYTPDVKTGWDEHWIGFKGEVASRFIQNMSVNPKKPVLKIGRDEVLRQRYIALVDAIGRDPAGTPFSSAGEILAILGLILENLRNVAMKGHGAKIIREAQNYILKNVLNPISFEHLAQELGMGYSSFRHHFKQQTGFSPASFQNSIRIGRARICYSQPTVPSLKLPNRQGLTASITFPDFSIRK